MSEAGLSRGFLSSRGYHIGVVLVSSNADLEDSNPAVISCLPGFIRNYLVTLIGSWTGDGSKRSQPLDQW